MSINLTPSNFFTTLIFEPEKAAKGQRTKALIASIACGVFTLGICHLVCFIRNYIIKHHPPHINPTLATIHNKAIEVLKLPSDYVSWKKLSDLEQADRIEEAHDHWLEGGSESLDDEDIPTGGACGLPPGVSSFESFISTMAMGKVKSFKPEDLASLNQQFNKVFNKDHDFKTLETLRGALLIQVYNEIKLPTIGDCITNGIRNETDLKDYLMINPSLLEGVRTKFEPFIG